LDPAEPLSGKPLGDQQVIKRHRAGFDTHPAWIEEMRRRDLVKMEKENEKAEMDARKAGGGTIPKLVTDRRSRNLGFPSTTTMNSVNKAWFICPTKRCPFWACHDALKEGHL